jgi:chemotaxis methyl-accepting protein methylase
MNDDQFKMLLTHRQLSWAGYRRVRKGVKKKIARHMRDLGCGLNMPKYLGAIDHDPLVEKECERRLAVSISRFFRDRPVWSALKQWLPHHLPKCPATVFRVWVAGCACGEEAFSLKVLWDEMELAPENKPRLSLLATDVNPAVLARARTGRYPLSSLREVTPACRDAYFHRSDDNRHYQVRQRLKEGIIWQPHDLRQKPPGNDYDLIFLRNSVLTYYAANRRDKALSPIVNTLVPGGALIVGAKETVPDRFMAQLQPGPHRNIFVRRC